MKITGSQFQNILERYLKITDESESKAETLKAQYRVAFIAAIEYLEKKTRDDVLNLAAMGADSAATFDEQKELFEQICLFLDATIAVDGNAKKFNQKYADGAKAVILDPHLKVSSGTRIYDDPQNLGIREKYARDELGKRHWLTDLDLERMMELTGTRTEISIMPLTTESIGAALHFAREKNKDSSAPYTIRFMLNKGSVGGAPGNHWVAAKVIVNPLEHTVHYQIDDSLGLRALQIEQYKTQIRAALGFNDGVHKAFSGDDGWTVDDGSPSHVIGHASQTDGYSCGYRAFQFLLQDIPEAERNENADNYAKLDPTDSWNLVKGFYTLQLGQQFQISRDAFNALGSGGRSRFVKPVVEDESSVQADTPKVLDFLGVLESPSPTKLSSDRVSNPIVAESVGKYTPGIPIIQFPGKKTTGIGSAEYESLLEQLEGNAILVQNPLPTLSLPFCDLAAIDGLNAHFSVSKVKLFETLEISLDLAASDTADEMVAKLKMALSNLSRAGVRMIALEDSKGVLKPKHIDAFVEHVRSQSITVDITLPEPYDKQSQQRTIDALVENNRRNQRLEELKGKRASEEELAGVKKSRPVRSRERIDMRQALKIDIERQEGVEEAAAFQKGEKAKPVEGIADVGDILYLGDLSDAAEEDNFSQFKGVADGHSKSGLVGLWHQIFGNTIVKGEFKLKAPLTRAPKRRVPDGFEIVDDPEHVGKQVLHSQVGGQTAIINEDFDGVTKAALGVLMKFDHVAAAGINKDQLPQGFVIVSDPEHVDKQILHYDSNAEPHNTIAPKLIEQEPPGIIRAETASRLMPSIKGPLASYWLEINSGEGYSREKSQAFRRYLPELLTMPEDQLTIVIGLCKEGDGADFNPLRLKAIFSNLEKARRAYTSKEATTAEILSQMVDSTWLTKAFPKEEDQSQFLALGAPAEIEIKAKPDLFSSVIDDEHLKASVLEVIKEYQLQSPEICALLRIQDKYGDPGIEKLMSAFKEMDAIDGIDLKNVPSIVHNPDAYESLVNSTKILENIQIVRGFSKEKRQWWDKLYQAHQPKADDFPSLVKSFSDFEVKIKELGIPNPFSKVPGADDLFKGAGNLPATLGRMLTIVSLAGQDRQEQWKVIAQIDLSAEGAVREMKGGLGFVVPDIGGDAQVQEKFFQSILRQKHRMPVSFYLEAVDVLERARGNKELPDEAVNDLYDLLLNSTKGENFKLFVEPDKAMEQWCAVVNEIKSIKITGMTGRAQIGATQALLGLEILPALPVLLHLVRLLASPLKKSIFEIRAEIAKLEPLTESLRLCLRKYDNSIYQGMRFYQQKDFEEGKFTYELTQEEVKEKIPQTPRGIFQEHLAIGLTLHHQGVGILMPLISTFKIRADRSDVLASKYRTLVGGPPKDQFNKVLVEYALKRFLEMENNDGLSPEKLAQFFDALKITLEDEYIKLLARVEELEPKVIAPESINRAELQEFVHLNSVRMAVQTGFHFASEHSDVVVDFSQKAIHDLVQRHFEDNFSEGYFEALKTEESSAAVDVVLDNCESFKNPQLLKAFDPIRKRFSKESDADKINLIRLFDTILRNESSLADKFQIIQNLSSELVKDSSYEDFYALLGSIEEYGSAGFSFLYDAVSDRPIEGFAKKAKFFSSSALPRFRSEDRTLTEVEAIGLIAELLIGAKTDYGELEANIYRFSSQVEAYDNFSMIINRRSVKPDEIEAGIEALVEAIPELSEDLSIKALREHLSDLNVEEKEERKEEAPETFMGSVFSGVESLVSGVSRIYGNLFWRDDEIPTEVRTLDSELLKKVSRHLDANSRREKSYDFALNHVISLIESLVTTYPAAKSIILPLMKELLSYHESSDIANFQVIVAKENIERVKNEFEALEDQNLVIGICEHFKGGDASFNRTDLLTIFKGGTLEGGLNFEKYPELTAEAKRQILTTVTSLLNNEKKCRLDDIQYLVERSTDEETGADFLRSLKSSYTKAPYPSLSDFKTWLDESESSKAEHVQARYTAWTKKPVFRESGDYDMIGGEEVFVEGVNGFRREDAPLIAEKMAGVTYTPADLDEIETQVQRVRDLTMLELLAEIGGIKDAHDEHRADPSAMVALMAELLYRTKGQDPRGVGDGHEWGRSFEINTTQYLALHSMFKVGGHVTSQIGTGEGKSRTSMLAIACLRALGKTVDFLTSDVSLATRDYLTYQPFFRALGIETTLIKSDSPAEQYRIGGINFSDASSLSLFRNKARSEGKGDLIIESDASKRAGFFDEADVVYFDSADTRLNYSAEADPAIRDMPWIYELLIEFFMDESNKDLYFRDADACNEAFYSFARGKLGEEEMARLTFNKDKPKPVVSRNQLEAWQGSALTALALEADKDYVIRPDVTIQTQSGARKVSQAQLIIGSRASEGAKYSFGVHQCLHARLNLERRTLQADKEGGKKDFTHQQQELLDLHSWFYLESEKQIVYSSSAKALLDDYGDGELLAVTGTAGAIKEREEAQALYGKGSEQPMRFIDVPRHRGLKRDDLGYSLANNPDTHRRKILEAVKASIARKQPVLLVCASEEKSQALFEFLNGSDGLTAEEKVKLQRIHAKTTVQEEGEYVEKKAGLSGAITVTTAMLGRGTDIKLHGDAKTHGLSVIATYLPRQRDYEQIIGRAGRMGARGMSQFVLEQGDVKALLGLPDSEAMPGDFHYATDGFLKQLQITQDRSAQKQRIISDVVGDFRLRLTKQYFEVFFNKVIADDGNNKDELLDPWRKFFDETDKEWNETRPKIIQELARTPVNPEAVKGLLDTYRESVAGYWDAMRGLLKAQITSGKLVIEIDDFNKWLPKDVGLIQLTPAAQALLETRIQAVTHRTPIADSWQIEHVGRAVIYTSWTAGFYAFFQNIASAWSGESPWFPSLRAWWNGNTSTTQLIFGSWGSPVADRSKSDIIKTEVEDVVDRAHDGHNSGKHMAASLGVKSDRIGHGPESDDELVSEEKEDVDTEVQHAPGVSHPDDEEIPVKSPQQGPY